MEKRGRKLEGKYSRWSPLSLSSMMMSGPLLFTHTHTHTHCPTLIPRSSVCEQARSLSPPQTGSLLPSHSLALSFSFLPVDDVISPALSSCSHFALAKTHLPESPCTQEHVHTLQSTQFCQNNKGFCVYLVTMT